MSAEPVVVLGGQYSGVPWVQQLLGADPSVTAMPGIGLLAACEQAADTWRRADGHLDGPLSSLGAASIRAMVTPIASSVLARTGRPRWCTAAVPGPAAGTFLQVFPGTRFVCLHRSCPDMIQATLAASPWGLSGSAYAPYVLQCPISNAAALAAYWADHAERSLEVEDKHPDACIRVRYEELTGSETARQALWEFLGLDHGTLPAAGFPTAEPERTPAEPFPRNQIAPQLLTRVNGLHAALDYPPVTGPVGAPPALAMVRP